MEPWRRFLRHHRIRVDKKKSYEKAGFSKGESCFLLFYKGWQKKLYQGV